MAKHQAAVGHLERPPRDPFLQVIPGLAHHYTAIILHRQARVDHTGSVLFSVLTLARIAFQL